MREFKAFKEAKLDEEKREKKAERMRRIEERSSLSADAISKDVKRINAKGIYKINLALYGKWDLFSLDEEYLDATLHVFSDRRLLKTSVLEKRKKIDDGFVPCIVLEDDFVQCYNLHQRIISPSVLEKNAAMLESKDIHVEDEKQLLHLIADMETMFFLFGYTYEEYIAFRFMDKSLEERLEFLSGAERKKVLIAINDENASDLFHDKQQTYIRFEKYFRRKQACVYDMNDFEAFQKFCKKVPAFVKKPLFSQKGRGVEPMKVDRGTDLHVLMEELLRENGPFVVEEIIQTHEDMKRLNPDSVNTVRVETFCDGGEAVIVTAFLRVGKKGQFVDNGSAGGIIIPIHLQTGRLTSVGRDKTNVTYFQHPDTGIVFNAYPIPKWKDLLKLSKKLSLMVPEVKYVGWDLTLNTKGKWVVVEGNARPGGFGNQRSSGCGVRNAFFTAIGMSPNVFR